MQKKLGWFGFIVFFILLLFSFCYYYPKQELQRHLSACQKSLNKLAKWDIPRITSFERRSRDGSYFVSVQFANGWGGWKNEEFFCDVICSSSDCFADIIPGSIDLLNRMYNRN